MDTESANLHREKSEGKRTCSGCKTPITDRFLLKALDRYWHEECLKCTCCGCKLGDIGSSLYWRSNLILCKRDYLRLFGIPGVCSACRKSIAAFELVMRAKDNVYHIECFACQYCAQRFCVGETFNFFNNKVLCKQHYQEEKYRNLSDAALKSLQ